MRIFKVHTALWLLLLLCVEAVPAYATPPASISVDVSYVELSDDVYLRFEFKLHGEQSYRIYCSDLPSGPMTVRKLRAHVKNKPSKQLTQLGYISDAGPLEFEMAPGYTYKDQIDLSGIFMNFRKIHEGHNIVVDWSYDLRSVDGYQFNDVTGSIVIPKSRSQNARPSTQQAGNFGPLVQHKFGPRSGPTVQVSSGGSAAALRCGGPSAART